MGACECKLLNTQSNLSERFLTQLITTVQQVFRENNSNFFNFDDVLRRVAETPIEGDVRSQVTRALNIAVNCNLLRYDPFNNVYRIVTPASGGKRENNKKNITSSRHGGDKRNVKVVIRTRNKRSKSSSGHRSSSNSSSRNSSCSTYTGSSRSRSRSRSRRKISVTSRKREHNRGRSTRRRPCQVTSRNRSHTSRRSTSSRCHNTKGSRSRPKRQNLHIRDLCPNTSRTKAIGPSSRSSAPGTPPLNPTIKSPEQQAREERRNRRRGLIPDNLGLQMRRGQPTRQALERDRHLRKEVRRRSSLYPGRYRRNRPHRQGNENSGVNPPPNAVNSGATIRPNRAPLNLSHAGNLTSFGTGNPRPIGPSAEGRATTHASPTRQNSGHVAPMNARVLPNVRENNSNNDESNNDMVTDDNSEASYISLRGRRIKTKPVVPKKRRRIP